MGPALKKPEFLISPLLLDVSYNEYLYMYWLILIQMDGGVYEFQDFDQV